MELSVLVLLNYSLSVDIIAMAWAHPFKKLFIHAP